MGSIEASRVSGGSVAEHKFTVTPAQAAEIRAWIRERMEADPHGGGKHGDVYAIHSLYLDSDELHTLRRIGSFGRAKYRIRRYGTSGEAYLERKLKSGGLIFKRRTPVPLAELARLTEPAPDSGWPGFWYHRRVQARGLNPVCEIQYVRTARQVALGSGRLRVTLDEQIAAAPVGGLIFDHSYPVGFPEDRVILEMKYRGATPALAQSLIDEFGLVPQPSSKYRIAGALLGLVALSEEPAGAAPRLVEELELA